VSVREGDAMNK